jgi:hypothetical protein
MGLKKTPVEKMIKSPSQRLRGILYRIWEKDIAPAQFALWYEEQIEKLISKLVEKIDKTEAK